MKRKITVALLLLVSVALGLLTAVSKLDSQSPHFVPVPPDFKVGAYARLSYNFLLPSPFESGLFWVTAGNKGGFRTYLYDIERKKVLGELTNGWPIFGNRDQSKVLVNG